MPKPEYKLGFVDHSVLQGLELTHYFNASEILKLQVTNEEKRKKKLAARLLLKFLVIREITSDPLELTSSALHTIPSHEYKALRIGVSANSERHLIISRDYEELPYTLSVSHGDGISIACVGQKAGLGIDIETPKPRIHAYYKQNFTSYERQWVYDNVCEEADEDQLFTFLWTLKESFIKSGCTDYKSAWYIPWFSIERLPRFQQINDTKESKFIIHDGCGYFFASTRLYNLYDQVLTANFFFK